MTHEFYKRYRPKKFRQVLGQAGPIKTLRNKLSKGQLPHTVLLSGPTGTGKTTLARITANELNCGKPIEMDAAQNNGIDTIRRIERRARMSPLGGECTVWIIDECHQLTTPAQQGFLKLLEDTPDNVYFFLCTTHPGKLLKTVEGRSLHLKLKPVSAADLKKLVEMVAGREGIELDPDVLSELTTLSEGSARKALVLLDAIREHDNTEAQLDVIRDAHTQRQGVEVARLLFKPGNNWNELAKLLEELKEDDAEGIRRIVLGYARVMLIKTPHKDRAVAVLESFADNYFDSGHAGLALSCWEVTNG